MADLVIRGIEESLMRRMKSTAGARGETLKELVVQVMDEWLLLRNGPVTVIDPIKELGRQAASRAPAGADRVDLYVGTAEPAKVASVAVADPTAEGSCPHHSNMTRAYCAKLYKGAKCKI